MKSKIIIIAAICLLFVFYSATLYANDYFPLQIGNKWIYSNSSGMEQKGYEITQIIDTTRFNENLYYCISQIIDNRKLENTYCRIDAQNQVWYFNTNKKEEELSYLRFDISPGLICTTYDSVNNLTRKVFLLDTNRIESTPAGTFKNCYYFHTILEEIHNEFGETYAPNIGLVANYFEPGGTRLKGAFVNGILYGDTSTVVSKIRSFNDPGLFDSDHTLITNYPNPFNSCTSITYQILKSSWATISVYSVSGKKIETLVSQLENPGIYRIIWQPQDIASGTYLLCLKNENQYSITKLLYLK